MVALGAGARGIGHVLITFDHLLIGERQPRRLVLRSTTLVRDDSFKTLLVVSNLVNFLSSFAAEVHALHLLGRLLKRLPVIFRSSTVHRRCLLLFLIRHHRIIV